MQLEHGLIIFDCGHIGKWVSGGGLREIDGLCPVCKKTVRVYNVRKLEVALAREWEAQAK